MSALAPWTTEPHRVTLAHRPVGEPRESDFSVEPCAITRPGDGQVLLETLWASVDPYQRSLMDAGGAHLPGLPVGSTIVGRTISRVLETRSTGFEPGDVVLAQSGWATHDVADASTVRHLDPSLPPTAILGVAGVSGACGYFGIEKLARPPPGETVVVAAAAGPVGSAAAQIARIRGARVVGIVSGSAKVHHARDVLGLDAAVDRTEPDFDSQLAAATPDGIDVYFENVGGTVFRSVVGRLNDHARIPVCGVASTYNRTTLPTGPDWTDQLLRLILAKRLRVEGFVQTDFYDSLEEEFHERCLSWIESGQLVYHEETTGGLHRAPEALRRVLSGESLGKALVRVALTPDDAPRADDGPSR